MEFLAKRTSRDRPKSAPYPRLKNSKRTSKFQSILFYSTKKIFLKKVSQRRKKLKGGTLCGFSIPSSLSQNPKKLKGGPFREIFSRKNVSQCRKNWKGWGTLWSRPALYVMQETFWFCSLANRWNLNFCRTFGRTILSVQVVFKKNTDEKPWL